MALISSVNNGDSGKTARTKINAAMASVERDSTLTGTGLAANPLGVNTATLSTLIDTYEVIEITDADSPYTPSKTVSNTIILADTYGGTISVTLPASNTWTGVITVKNVGSYTVTVTPNGVETIDGQSSWTVEDEGTAGVMESYDFFNNGSNVFVR